MMQEMPTSRLAEAEQLIAKLDDLFAHSKVTNAELIWNIGKQAVHKLERAFALMG
jgi:hypothetical protein